MRPAAFAFLVSTAALPAAADTVVPPGVIAPEVALLDGWRQPDGSRLAAVEIRLAPGWHTYWRVPGEAGIPPSFDWSGSENLASVAYEWPRPTILDSFGMRTYGYEGTLVLPVRLVPRNPAAPIAVALDLDFGICSDICVPAEARLTRSLAPDAPPADRTRIEAALAERAQSPEEAGVAAVTCTLEPAGQGFALTAAITFAATPGPGQVALVEFGQTGLWIGLPESRTDGRTVIASAPVLGTGDAGPTVARDALRLTVLDDHRAVDIRGCRAPG